MARADTETLKKKEYELVETLSAPQQEFKEEELTHNNISFTLVQANLEYQIARTVKEIFAHEEERNRNKTETQIIEQMTKAYFPSTSANYVNSRQDAGSVGTILSDPDIAELRRAGGYVREQRTERSNDEDVRESHEDENYKHNMTEFENAQYQMFALCVEKALREENTAEPVALPEALKIRVITKMPPFRSFVLKFLQKAMHKVLRQHKCFRLIGSPTGLESSLATYIDTQLRLSEGLKEDEIIVSGDYKAATDNLKSWASECAAREISKIMRLPSYMDKLFIESLTRHTLVKGEMSGIQTKGQLMGSITSFPILCIINAAITRYAIELGTQKLVKLHKCDAMFNGDDVLFKSNRHSMEWWRMIIAKVGLEESIGKTYYSREFVQINSTNFIVKATGGVELVKYVNSGLLKGMKRSGGQVEVSNEEGITIGQNYRELLRMAPQRLYEQCHNGFFKANQEAVNTFKKYNIPWHVPEWLGGAGLTGFKEPTHLDRCMAQKILFNWKNKNPRSLAQPETEWKIRSKATKKLPSPQWTEDPEHPGIAAYNELVNQRTLDILLDKNVDLEDLLPRSGEGYDELAEKDRRYKYTLSVLKHNSKLWAVGRSGNLPGAMSLDDMIYKARYTYIGTHNDRPEKVDVAFWALQADDEARIDRESYEVHEKLWIARNVKEERLEVEITSNLETNINLGEKEFVVGEVVMEEVKSERRGDAFSDDEWDDQIPLFGRRWDDEEEGAVVKTTATKSKPIRNHRYHHIKKELRVSDPGYTDQGDNLAEFF